METTGRNTAIIFRNSKNGYDICERLFSQWCFREFQSLIEYKAKLYGSQVVYVNPQYTSISCPVCDYTAKENGNGKEFSCKNCGFKEHADIVSAKNIMLRVLKFLQNRAFVSRPNAPIRGRASSALKCGVAD